MVLDRGKQKNKQLMKHLFKNIILGVSIVSLITLINSCKKNTQNLVAEQKNVTVINLANSQAFVKLVSNLDNIEIHLNNVGILSPIEKSQLRNYLTSNSITEHQLAIVAKYSGYDSLKEFIEVFNTQYKLLTELKTEFKDIKNISEDSIFEAISMVHIKHGNGVKVAQLSPEELCRRIYNNCSSRASSTYTATIVGCTFTAIGVGAGTALIGGVVFQLGCGGIAYWNLSLQRDECALNYESCLKK
jgi:NACalpha-BTF3-like transcription factor